MIEAPTNAVELEVEVQNAVENADGEEPPSGQSISHWAQSAYAAVGSDHPAELTIRIVGAEEMQALNYTYRNQNKTTNVLSFPVELDSSVGADLALNPLGDVVICHPVIVLEAQQQQKSTHDHYAHMVTHGVLHLCGFDHQNEPEAQQMEALESQVLAGLQIANPY